MSKKPFNTKSGNLGKPSTSKPGPTEKLTKEDLDKKQAAIPARRPKAGP